MALPARRDVGDAMVTPISRAMSVPLINRWLPPKYHEISEWGANLAYPRGGLWQMRQQVTEVHVWGAAELRIEVGSW